MEFRNQNELAERKIDIHSTVEQWTWEQFSLMQAEPFYKECWPVDSQQFLFHAQHISDSFTTIEQKGY